MFKFPSIVNRLFKRNNFLDFSTFVFICFLCPKISASQVPSNFFEHFDPLLIFTIFDYLEVEEFQSAIEMYNITPSQKQGFPKYSFRTYGNHIIEYYPNENGFQIFPSWVKQVAKVYMSAHDLDEQLSLHVILNYNGHLEFKYFQTIEWNFYDEKSVNDIESFFIGEFKHSGVLIAPKYQNSDDDSDFLLKIVDGLIHGKYSSFIGINNDNKLLLFSFLPSININIYVYFHNILNTLFVYLHEFTEGQTKKMMGCEYADVNPNIFYASVNNATREVEYITFMEQNMTNNEFFNKNYYECAQPSGPYFYAQ
jgi:hypothetical protein